MCSVPEPQEQKAPAAPAAPATTESPDLDLNDTADTKAGMRRIGRMRLRTDVTPKTGVYLPKMKRTV